MRVQAQPGPHHDMRDTLDARRRGPFVEVEVVAPHRRNQRRGGRYDYDEDQSPSPDPDALGPLAFSPEIRNTTIPSRFRFPANFSKYDGETNPAHWLEDFQLACRASGASDDVVVIRNRSLFLADSARTWLKHLLSG